MAGTDVVQPPFTSFAIEGAGEVYRTTAVVTGPALALRVFLDAGSRASRAILGIYTESDGDASELLGTARLDAPQAGAWNEARLDTPVPLVAGRRYWIALLNPRGSGGNLVWHDRAAAAGDYERTSQSHELTALPQVWATRVLYPDGGPLSAAIVGRPAAAPLTGAVNAPACVKPTPTPVPTVSPTPTPVPTVSPTPSPTPQSKPKPLPRLTAPSRLTRRAGKVALSLSCPKVASCRFTVKLGGRSATRTVKAGKRATIKLKAPKARRAKLTITRRTDGRTDTVKRYVMISGRAGSASRATRAA